MPTTESTLLLFVTFLVKDDLAYTTIKVYIAAIHNLHTSSGLHNTYSQQLTPYLEQVLQGIKKEQLQSRPPRVRLPITTEIMSCIHKMLSKSPNNHHNVMMWVACCTAFFGFLYIRCSEFTVPSSNGFEPVTHLSLKDIALDNKTFPSLVRINIKQSKTDPFRKGFHLFLGCTGHHICAVKALFPYLAVYGSTEGPLFITKEVFPLTRHRFSTELSRILHAAG